MRFNIDGKLLQQQLTAVNRVINSKNALSILDNFLFELEGAELTITGSDQENTVKAKLEVLDSDGFGRIAVPAKTLLEITKEVNNQPVHFHLNEQTGEIELEFLNGQFKFMGITRHKCDILLVNIPKYSGHDGSDGFLAHCIYRVLYSF